MATLGQVFVRRPWWWVIAVILLMITIGPTVSPQNSGVLHVQSPSFQGETNQPVAPPVRSIDATSRDVQTQEVVPPAAPEMVGCRATPWVPVRDGFDPSTISVEEGFYSGTGAYSLYPGTSKGDGDVSPPPELEGKLHSSRYMNAEVPGYGIQSVPAPMRARYAWRVLPHLEGLPVGVAAARDETNKDIVLVGFDADRYGAYILFSADGEESFCKLDLLPRDHRRDAVATRVVALGEEIRLYGKDPRPGNHWWEKVITRSELP